VQITRSSIDTAKGPADWFTGDVYIDAVAAAPAPSRVTADVTSEDDVQAAVDHTVERFGRLDAAFNNAGVEQPVDAADESAEQFDRVQAINLRGIWASMKHELRHMRNQGSGAIVNCSSLGGLVDHPRQVLGHRGGDHPDSPPPAPSAEEKPGPKRH
jgi:NAD(P)-dependent dehydrogenase (short-subunit alcohol dehydrogenase family)